VLHNDVEGERRRGVWGNTVLPVCEFARQERQEARQKRVEAGFLLRVFPKERRYAELGYLLPILIGPAVKTRCVGPSSWHAIYIYPTTVRTFGYTPVGHGARPQPILAEVNDPPTIPLRATPSTANYPVAEPVENAVVIVSWPTTHG